MIASPLSVWLMGMFTTPTHIGVAETFVVLGVVYFMLHDGRLCSPCACRRQAGSRKAMWRRHSRRSWSPRTTSSSRRLKTPQFWLIWWVLCLNVTAGIGVLGQASRHEPGNVPGTVSRRLRRLGFVGLMSLFNMGGRFGWATVSDYIGRRNTYFVFMVLGFILYCTVPYTGAIGNVAAFVACFLIIISMYGGGFATVPAYLSDMFGTRYVGAIHGLLLTAWSAAGIFGPVLVNYIRAYNVAHGVPKADAYNTTMYIMAALLVIGFICNFFVKAVDPRYHMKDDDGRGVEALEAGARA